MIAKNFCMAVPFFLLCVGVGFNVHSQEYCQSAAKFDALQIETRKWDNALRDRRFVDMDAHFNGLAAAYERGDMDDDAVERWFRIFDKDSPALEPLHQEWINKYPASFAAELAAAKYFHTVGYAKRGTGSAGDTSESQFEAMKISFKAALSHLERAEKLTTKPTLVIAERLALIKSVGARSDVIALYKQGESVDPNNMRVKAAYIFASNPKWGGSFEALDDIVKSTRASKLNNGIKSFVEYLVIYEYADIAWREKQYDDAIKLYERASQLCPAFEEILTNLLKLYNSQKRFSEMRSAADRYIKRQPNSGWGYSQRAWANYHLSDLKQAKTDAENASTRGDGYGTYLLGWFYDIGNSVVPRDAKKALDLYISSLNRGYSRARSDVERLRSELRK